MGKRSAEDEELNISDDGAEEGEQGQEEEEEGGAEDRGDNPNPEETTENLEAVAGSKEEEEEEEPEGDDKRSKTVPHARFHEVNEQAKRDRARMLELEEENARLRGGAPAKKTAAAEADGEEESGAFDFDAKEEAYADALMEGDKKKAAAIRREVNAEIQRQAEASSAARVRQEIETRATKSAFDAVVKETIEKYPFLDAKGEDADKEAIAEVVEWRDFYIGKGDAPAIALRKAAERVAKPKIQAKAEAADEEEDDGKGDESKKKGDTLAQLRQQRILKRNAEAANRQPPKGGDAGVGNRATTATALDVEEMTEAEFDKLPEKEKKRLRGDNV